jgi:hypothetical protein
MTEYQFDGFRFEVAADLADAGRVSVLVFRGGEPFLDLHGAQMRKLFPAKAGARRIEQFCQRFALDDAFRTGTILKHAFACC